jgi:hypothetical protein
MTITLNMVGLMSYSWAWKATRKAIRNQCLYGQPVEIRVRKYLMNDQRDTTKERSGTEPKKTPESSLEEQVQRMFADMEKDKGRKLTQQEKNVARDQAIDFGDADTTSAVYGQLGGSFYHAEGIPAGWLDKLAMQ